jgi:hypothetical protein
MSSEWSHLPNAAHIDRVLAHVKAHPDRWDAARVTAWGADRDAIAALIAWDDCANILDMPADAVRLLAASGHHPAVLLLPAVLAMEENV